MGTPGGATHGGFLVTLADSALGYTAAASVDPPLQVTTVSISADFGDGAAIFFVRTQREFSSLK